MAFRKTAKALVQHPGIHAPEWTRWRQQLQRQGHTRVASTLNLADQASEILGERFDPSKYLLTHVTIVSSVDTEPVTNVKLGSVEEGGKTVLRKFADYHITPTTEQFINNNNDAFSRGVLLKSYRTFVGGHNWLEHVQLVEQSKGRLLDAVARDIGPSVYVDLLVATHRKHAELIQKIESGELTTLSMGCSCTHTTCTKCGNVAYDEVQLCDCVRYAKGNKFFDTTGMQRRIAELCGHESEEPTGGVNFIEASWVEVPAFTGAVMRSIIEPAKLSPKSLKQMKAVLESAPKEWVKDQPQKAAKLDKSAYIMADAVGDLEPQEGEVVSRVRKTPGIQASSGSWQDAKKTVESYRLPTLRDLTSGTREERGTPMLATNRTRAADLQARATRLARIEAGKAALRKVGFSEHELERMVWAEDDFDFGDEPTDGAPAEAPGESTEEDELGDLVKETGKEVLKRVKKQLKDQITPKDIEPSLEEGTPSTSNNVIKDGSRRQYLAGLGAIVAISKSSHELLDNVFRYHEACGRPISKRLHRAASMAVASTEPFSKACVRALGRKPSEGDLKTIVRLGRLLALRTP